MLWSNELGLTCRPSVASGTSFLWDIHTKLLLPLDIGQMSFLHALAWIFYVYPINNVELHLGQCGICSHMDAHGNTVSMAEQHGSPKNPKTKQKKTLLLPEVS